ncbi:MAG: hypothetical protein HQK54_09300 [Oligoflexales bacterium]|nr:hypothetical protein [Oligoflexales bacterium]
MIKILKTGALIFLSGWAFTKGSKAETSVNISARIDCPYNQNLSKGQKQECATISGFRLGVEDEISPKLRAYLKIDPYGAPSESLQNRPRFLRSEYPTPVTDSAMSIINDYGIVWQFRPGLAISIQNFGGTTILPSQSGLSMASMFQDSGWNQTALLASYKLAPLDGIKVTLAVGNGEGEVGENHDIQQYGGVDIVAGIVPGIKIKTALSMDQNNTGSRAYDWMFKGQYPNGQNPHLGFSTNRMAVAIIMDGNYENAKGLMLSLGVQKTTMSDLDKNISSVPANFYSQTTRRFDPNDIIVEDTTGENAISIQRIIKNFSFSYKILADYFIAFDYETRTVNTDTVKFFMKKGTDGINTLNQTAFTGGFGLALEEGLVLTIEYRSSSYDNNYDNFYFDKNSDEKSKNQEIINTRISYAW